MWRPSSLSNNWRMPVLPETGSLSACSLWDAGGCSLTAEQICTEALNYSLDVGIPTCLLGSCSSFTPSLVTTGWMCLCLNPSLWFQRSPAQSGSAAVCWQLFLTSHSLPLLIAAWILGSMVILLKTKEQTAFQIPHFTSKVANCLRKVMMCAAPA